MSMEGCAAELRHYFAMADHGSLRVALVGNGGLSEKCREDIAAGCFDHIVRFNDQKNYRLGDAPSTLHVVRQRIDAVDAPFTGLALYKRHVPLLLCGGGSLILGKPLNELPGVYKCPDGDWYEVAASLDLGRSKFFPGEKAAEFTLKEPQGPSTGLWTMALFQIIPEVKEIHTFGMNWAFDNDAEDVAAQGIPGKKYSHSSEEGVLVQEGKTESGERVFSKVTVHPTPTREYDPPTIDNPATARQKSTDLSGYPFWSTFITSNREAFKAMTGNRFRNHTPPTF